MYSLFLLHIIIIILDHHCVTIFLVTILFLGTFLTTDVYFFFCINSWVNMANYGWWMRTSNHLVTQGRLFTSIRDSGRRGESSEWSASATGTNNDSFATGLTQNRQLKKDGDQNQHQRNHRSLCHIKQPQEKCLVNVLLVLCLLLLWNPWLIVKSFL